jgi:hypothetical protein
MIIDKDVKETVGDFILNYAEESISDFEKISS